VPSAEKRAPVRSKSPNVSGSGAAPSIVVSHN
jgi:hypothetical protein